ncbi:Selenocysteine-specific elongation factor [Tieghemostelium lacteum]|uniref:Cleavage and polyadenylation specificity factor subunit 2 n=1 Tax=Tieghemostelium lacteum TaxID=361077 RepID=A0A152A8K7_TIELA|nr:Selenocysteine-specific elongation factor [Tieghemostelium lacteum]|eukprot:KYR02534.1 Selenocysteine-specific elongation factor [Tieghemostelium lacteum]
MSSLINFRAISGAQNEDPPCYLLEIDDFCILLDCGLNSHLDFTLLEGLKKVANQIDAILISYPDLTHMGALPWAVSKLGMTGVIYGTTPIYKMGQMFLYDLYQNKMEQEEFDKFDLDDVDVCFDKKRFKELSFSQHYSLQGKGKGISITPYNAGHMIGGAIWKIQKESDTVIYAINYNHKKEGHLDGINLTNDLIKPSLLITDSRNALRPASLKKMDRDKQLLETMKQTLRLGGNVLLPIDTAGRVLELLFSIENHWGKLTHNYNVVFLNHETYHICEFAKSQLEFMSSSASKQFEQKNEIFSFRNIKLCHSLEELQGTTNPKVVLASSKDIETGFARDLFIEWAQDSKNLLLFTDYVDENTLGSFLLSSIESPHVLERAIELHQGRRVALVGDELVQYEIKQQQLKEEQKLAEKKKKEEEELQKIMDQISDLTDENEIDDRLYDLKNPFQSRFDMTKDQFQQEGFVPMFPFFEKHLTMGDYGEEDDDFIQRNIESQKIVDQEMYPVEETTEHDVTPTKTIQVQYHIKVNCKIQYIDFEGCADGRSIKSIIQKISPNQLVLIRGKPEASQNMLQFVKENIRLKGVHCPQVDEKLNLTSDTNVYKVILKDSFYNSIKFSKIMDYEISFIQAKINYTPTIVSMDITSTITTTTTPQTQQQQQQTNNNNVPILDIVPNVSNYSHNPSFIGDIKLSEFKQILMDKGYQIQFEQGVLNCNGLVYIWRDEDQQGNSIISMDGIISDEYYSIRELLYQQYQIL